MKKYCSNCGYELDTNDIFCPNCGQKCEVLSETENIIQDLAENTTNNFPPISNGNNNIKHKSFKSTCLIGGAMIILAFVIAIVLNLSNKKHTEETAITQTKGNMTQKSQISKGMVYKMKIDEYVNTFNALVLDKDTNTYDRNIPAMTLGDITLGDTVTKTEEEKYDSYVYNNNRIIDGESVLVNYTFVIALMVEPETENIIGLSSQLPKNDSSLAIKLIKMLCPKFKKDDYKNLTETLSKVGYAFCYKDGSVFELSNSQNNENSVMLRMTATTKENYKERWENNPDLPTTENVKEMEKNGYSDFSGTWETESTNEGKNQLIISSIKDNNLVFTLQCLSNESNEKKAIIQNVSATIENRVAEFDYTDDNGGGFGKGKIQFEQNNIITVNINGLGYFTLTSNIYKKVSDNIDSSTNTPANNNESSTNGDFIFPDSDSRYLSETEVRNIDPSLLTYARNEIFARRGRMFDDPDISGYFNNKSWYKGTIPGNQFDNTIMNTLNDFEKSNVELIKNEEQLQEDFKRQENWNNSNP